MSIPFRETKVITRNFLQDFVNHLRNFVGANVPSFEKRIDDAAKKLQEKYTDDHIWYRMQVTAILDGMVCIMIYGEKDGL